MKREIRIPLMNDGDLDINTRWVTSSLRKEEGTGLMSSHVLVQGAALTVLQTQLVSHDRRDKK